MDIEAKPGSPTSLLRTFIGLHLRDLGGWIPVAVLIELLGEAGVSASSARSAVSRLSMTKRATAKASAGSTAGTGSSAQLIAESRSGVVGYGLDPAAVTELERGDRRIFSYREQGDDGSWCLVSYSLPEVDRTKRTQLRRQLVGLGFGTVADGLWIAPEHLRPEVEDVLDALDVRGSATIFTTGEPSTAGTFAEAAARWWPLTRLADRHRRFVDRYAPLVSGRTPQVGARQGGAESGSAEREGADAFALWLRCVDDWKTIPYVDPGLPPSALPAQWPGRSSVETFDSARALWAEPARAYARSVAGLGLSPACAGAGARTDSPPLPPAHGMR